MCGFVDGFSSISDSVPFIFFDGFWFKSVFHGKVFFVDSSWGNFDEFDGFIFSVELDHVIEFSDFFDESSLGEMREDRRIGRFEIERIIYEFRLKIIGGKKISFSFFFFFLF